MIESGVCAELSDAEVGLRPRYEIAREFPHYIGISHSSKLGGAGDFARAAYETLSTINFVVRIQAWLYASEPRREGEC